MTRPDDQVNEDANQQRADASADGGAGASPLEPQPDAQPDAHSREAELAGEPSGAANDLSSGRSPAEAEPAEREPAGTPRESQPGHLASPGGGFQHGVPRSLLETHLDSREYAGEPEAEARERERRLASRHETPLPSELPALPPVGGDADADAPDAAAEQRLESSASIDRRSIATGLGFAPSPLPTYVPGNVNVRDATTVRSRFEEPTEPVLRLERISVQSTERDRALLTDVSLSIVPGEVLGLLGGSESGKSAVIASACGLVRPTAGLALVDGIDPSRAAYRDAQRARQKIGVVLQGGVLIANLNAYDNITLPLRYHTTLPEELLEQRVDELLEEFDLDPTIAAKMPARLSASQRLRVDIARALITKPKVLLMDEPFATLDIDRVGLVLDRLERRRERDGLSLIVTSSVARPLVDFVHRLGLLDRGRLIAIDETGTVLRSGELPVRRLLERMFRKGAGPREATWQAGEAVG